MDAVLEGYNGQGSYIVLNFELDYNSIFLYLIQAQSLLMAKLGLAKHIQWRVSGDTVCMCYDL